MTLSLIPNPLKVFKIFTLSLVVLMMVSSCTNKLKFLTSTVVPAARGNVKIKMDDNKNHTIDISLINLAEPGRLSPPKQMYIVWMETDQNIIKNLGQIVSDNGNFSKTLKANFKTVSSFTPAKIFITAEDDANVQSPSWQVILTTERF